ncbi:MAG: DUF58 domain-containing protein [Solirubrobacterales bacterium]|nr:DUF58 domain-containing protein [Solirubrobacterales bacterium]
MRRSLAAAGLGLSLCLVGGAFAATTLFVPGVALLLLAGTATGWVWLAARGARVERVLSGTSVQERAPLRATVHAARKRVPLPGVEARAWPGGPLLALARSRDAVVTAEVHFARRGRHQLAPASVVIGDPLGLASRTILSLADQVLVLPRIEPLRPTDLVGRTATWPGHGAPALGAGATEVDSLVVHQPGAPASRIHWPTVARTTTLMERRLVDGGDQVPLVVVDPRDPSSADALDQALRAAASLCIHLAREGGCGLLLPGDRRPARFDRELRGFPESHARLALLEPDDGAPPLAWLAGAHTIIWVTAANAHAGSMAQLRAPARYLVSPHPRPGWPVRFTVAGCSGQSLDELAKRAA